MDRATGKWISVSLYNLLIVAFLGVTLRYKIAFNLPFVDQKYILHAHSHFAFAGWVSHTIMVFMIAYLAKEKFDAFQKYKWILVTNLISAYGMLFTFPIQGYGSFSITFSTLSVFTSYVFAVVYWRDLNRLRIKNVIHKWFKGALIFSVLSSAGSFGLAYMMASKVVSQHFFLAAVYYFLHFQYNGWFFFACMGLLYYKLMKDRLTSLSPIVFYLFVFACIPAYFLSILWLKVPMWLTVIIIISSFIQMIAWGIFSFEMKKNYNKISVLKKNTKIIWSLSGIALTIKLLLQLGSTHPFLSNLAFGFRPIVIAYLHLVLLGVISLFLIGYIFEKSTISKAFQTGCIVFIAGVILNELALMVQGVGGIAYISIPYINYILFGIALILLSGAGIMAFSYKTNQLQADANANTFPSESAT